MAPSWLSISSLPKWLCMSLLPWHKAGFWRNLACWQLDFVYTFAAWNINQSYAVFRFTVHFFLAQMALHEFSMAQSWVLTGSSLLTIGFCLLLLYEISTSHMLCLGLDNLLTYLIDCRKNFILMHLEITLWKILLDDKIERNFLVIIWYW